LHLSEEEDEWRWEREGSGVFSVKSAYLLLGSVFDQASILTGPVLRVLSLPVKYVEGSSTLEGFGFCVETIAQPHSDKGKFGVSRDCR
jgi:hypothetical protein